MALLMTVGPVNAAGDRQFMGLGKRLKEIPRERMLQALMAAESDFKVCINCSYMGVVQDRDEIDCKDTPYHKQQAHTISCANCGEVYLRMKGVGDEKPTYLRKAMR